MRVCAGWSEPLLVAHTTLLEISCHGSLLCVRISVLPSPGKYVSTRGNGFNLSKCFIYLGKLSWCAGVCDGTGKIEDKIGGGLVF